MLQIPEPNALVIAVGYEQPQSRFFVFQKAFGHKRDDRSYSYRDNLRRKAWPHDIDFYTQKIRMGKHLKVPGASVEVTVLH